MKFKSLILLGYGGVALACAAPNPGASSSSDRDPPDDEMIAGAGGGGGDGVGGVGGVGGPNPDDPLPPLPTNDAAVSSRSDAGTPPPRRDAAMPNVFEQGVFVAIGHGGRRITSCDDGRTWSHEQKMNDSDADHAEWAGMGVAYGEGTFVSLFGWGVPTARMFRSDDGASWQQTFGVNPMGSTATSITYGDGAFLAVADRSKAYVSNDLGRSWRTVVFGGDAPVLRRLVFSEGTFIAFGDNARVVASSDGGSTWRNVSIPAACRGQFDGSVAVGNGTILGVGRDSGCRSRDRGATWTSFSAPSIPGEVVWTGRDFYATGLREAYRTVDGETWTTEKHSLEQNTWVRFLAVGDNGTFVGVDERGDRFFRSTDGRTWTRANAPAGTTITAMRFGRVRAGGLCSTNSSAGL